MGDIYKVLSLRIMGGLLENNYAPCTICACQSNGFTCHLSESSRLLVVWEKKLLHHQHEWSLEIILSFQYEI